MKESTYVRLVGRTKSPLISNQTNYEQCLAFNNLEYAFNMFLVVRNCSEFSLSSRSAVC